MPHAPPDPTGGETPPDPIAEFIQQDLAQIGVGVTIEASREQNVLDTGNFDITFDYQVGDAFPLMDLYLQFGTTGGDNSGKIGSPEIDATIRRVLAEFDEGKARDAANEVDKMVWREGFDLPLYQSPGIYAVRNDLANYGAFGPADINYAAIGFTNSAALCRPAGPAINGSRSPAALVSPVATTTDWAHGSTAGLRFRAFGVPRVYCEHLLTDKRIPRR